jgi:Flp pilus assembly protein TadB
MLAAAAAWVAPGMVRRDDVAGREIARVEGVAGWAEMLRDTLSAAAGLEQAIIATAPVAPEPVAGPVRALASALQTGRPLPTAVREFADQAGDPAADLVAGALLLAAEHPAGDLAALLGALAAAAREQAGMRRRVMAGRARLATTVRTVIGSTLALAAALAVLNRGYLAAYATPSGQLVLLAVAGLFGAGLVWLRRLARFRPPARLLAGPPVAGVVR